MRHSVCMPLHAQRGPLSSDIQLTVMSEATRTGHEPQWCTVLCDWRRVDEALLWPCFEVSFGETPNPTLPLAPLPNTGAATSVWMGNWACDCKALWTSRKLENRHRSVRHLPLSEMAEKQNLFLKSNPNFTFSFYVSKRQHAVWKRALYQA